MNLHRAIPTLDPRWGGPCQGMRNAAPALMQRGVKTEALCADPDDASWVAADSFPVNALGPGKFGYAYSGRMLHWLRGNLDRFDAVIVHTLWQWHGAAVLLALKERKRKHKSSPALFVMPHGGLDPWYQRDRSRRLKALRNIVYWWAIERRLINSADALLFTSREEGELARTTFAGYAPRREYCVNYGIPAAPEFTNKMDEAFRRVAPKVPTGSPYFLYLGRIHPKKGVDWLMEAYAQFVAAAPSARDVPALVVAGPGEESPFGQRVKGFVSRHGLQDHVSFTGMLEGDSKWGALYGCEACVMCSHQENFGISIVEALSCDRPVLITDKVNIWREIKAGGGGLVCEQDRSAFANLLQHWTQTGRDAHKLSPRRCYERNFGIEQHAEVFASTISEVLAERDTASSS
jgi:glycosyltransferase involved in cell wall biosynthesis